MTDGGGRPVRHRRTARVLLLDEADRLLLLQVEDGAAPGRRWWVTVGGGLEPGEDLRAAARREALEETGIALGDADLGAHVWTRRVIHGYSDRIVEQDEDFLLARLPAGAVVDGSGSDELAARWFSTAELRELPEATWPRDLADLFPGILAGGWVGEPRRLPDAVEDAPGAPPMAQATTPAPVAVTLAVGDVTSFDVQRVRRRASRVLLVDDRDRLLLLSAGTADGSEAAADGPGAGDGPWWFTCGGGIEEGETAEAAAVREVREETGLVLDPVALGPVVHRRRVIFPWGGRLLDSDEEFRVARVPAYDVDTTGFDATERALITGARWWTLAELDTAHARLAPPELPALLAAALTGRG